MTEWRDAIEKSLEWIEENITDDFTLYELANHAGYSPFYFSRLFRQVVGVTIKKHIADRRLCRAALDVRDSDARIIDIAVTYGFSSQEALTRAMKSAYGLTPHAFRKAPHLITLPTQKVVLPPEKFFTKGEKTMSELNKATGISGNLVLVNIVSPAPLKLAEFYKNILGADINDSPTHGYPNRIEMWFGPRTDSTVCIVANFDEGFTPPKFNACQGFEFRVPDADAEYDRIRALGIECKEPPKNLPWGYRFFHIKDPDGNGIDIVAKI